MNLASPTANWFLFPGSFLFRLPIYKYLLVLVACAMVGALTGCSNETPKFKAIDVTGVTYANAINANAQMLDTQGRIVTIDQFKGKIVVIFFGFTQCPEACPTTLAEVAQAKTLLGPIGSKVQPIFVTLDPQRDTADILQPYVTSFGPDFMALRGTPEKTAALAKAFKVYYTVVPGKTVGNYTLDHSTGSYIIDTQGRVRLYTRYGSGAQALADDIQLLLKHS